MTSRTVKKLLYAVQIEMGDIPVRQPLPNAGTDQIDPFLLIHHHKSDIPAGSNPKDHGVGPHPHRGFSPVTIIYKGDVHHRDSRGNNSVVKSGGVQWMQSGMGIVHSERPSESFAKEGGTQEIIQLWVNSPAAHKLDPPAYYAMHEEDIPYIDSPSRDIRINVIAGNYHGTQGFNHLFSKMMILDVRMKAGSSYEFNIPANYNLCIYNLDSRIMVGNFGMVDAYYLLCFNHDGEIVPISCMDDTRLLILAGEPLNEPLQTYGPFVMNNQTEVMQAIKDYQMGKMGVLIEDDFTSANQAS